MNDGSSCAFEYSIIMLVKSSIGTVSWKFDTVAREHYFINDNVYEAVTEEVDNITNEKVSREVMCFIPSKLLENFLMNCNCS